MKKLTIKPGTVPGSKYARKRKIPAHVRIKRGIQLTGEKKPGEKRIEVRKGLWVISARPAAVVRAEYEARRNSELQKLNNTISPEYKQRAYQKSKLKKEEKKRGDVL